MDVDIYDSEIIAYLARRDIKELKTKNQIHKNSSINDDSVSSFSDRKFDITLQYSERQTSQSEHYDDIMDALQEVNNMLYELNQQLVNEIENPENSSLEVEILAIMDKYNWKKVMKTYEYYDNIRNQYE